LLLAALTLISGSASVKLPGANVAISISEAFTFTAVLLYGAAAGTLIVTLDGLVIAFWIARRRPEGIRALFNFTAPALSAWVSAHVFFKTSGIAPLVEQAATLKPNPSIVGAVRTFVLQPKQLADSLHRRIRETKESRRNLAPRIHLAFSELLLRRLRGRVTGWIQPNH
jgi:hypothetical protein